jgi:hypothetical protein
MKETHTITLEESQRQAILLAMAHLALARPGWDYMLTEIALGMDNKRPDGKPQMFTEFKTIETQNRAADKTKNALASGYLRGLSGSEKHDFADNERAILRHASETLRHLCGVAHVSEADIAAVNQTIEGPGKYDAECAAAHEASQALACILLVISGKNGNGMSVKAPLIVIERIPEMLRTCATLVEQQHNQAKGN